MNWINLKDEWVNLDLIVRIWKSDVIKSDTIDMSRCYIDLENINKRHHELKYKNIKERDEDYSRIERIISKTYQL